MDEQFKKHLKTKGDVLEREVLALLNNIIDNIEYNLNAFRHNMNTSHPATLVYTQICEFLHETQALCPEVGQLLAELKVLGCVYHSMLDAERDKENKKANEKLEAIMKGE